LASAQPVSPGEAIEGVISGIPIHVGCTTEAEVETVIAIAAIHRVEARRPHHKVIADKRIVIAAAIEFVIAAKAPEQIIATAALGVVSAVACCAGGSAVDEAQAEAMLTLMRTGWGQENPAFRQVFTSLFVPGGTPEQMDWFNELQRKTTSPENAVRIRLISDYMNVIDLLPQVTTPTLVLHCRDDAIQPFDEGRYLAANIPGARFVSLEGRNHLILENDPGWPVFKQEVGSYLS
jgi:pimeloyl-ACP methyl ester carboxylesterase